MGCPGEGLAGIVPETVDMGTLAVKVGQLVGHRYCAHVDHEYLVNLQRRESLTEACGKLEGMDDSFEWSP